MQLIRKWQERNRQRAYAEGYTWATNALRRGELTRQEIEARCLDPIDPSEFDQGAMAALKNKPG